MTTEPHFHVTTTHALLHTFSVVYAEVAVQEGAACFLVTVEAGRSRRRETDPAGQAEMSNEKNVNDLKDKQRQSGAGRIELH